MSDFNSLVQYTVENISRPVKYIIYKLTEFIRVVDKFVFRQVPAGAASGYATIEKVEGNTVAWNQLVDTGSTSVVVQSGHVYYANINGTASIATSDGTPISVTGGTDIIHDLTTIFGAGNEPTTVAHFEAWMAQNGLPSVADYNSGELLSVKMSGVKSVGFNQWDEQWELGTLAQGQPSFASTRIRTKNYIPVIGGATYFFKFPWAKFVCSYDDNYNYLGNITITNNIATLDGQVKYLKWSSYTAEAITTYNNDICINLSDPAKNGTYEPYQFDLADIDVTTITGINSITNVREVIFPNGMKQADREGTVKDTLDLRSDTATVKYGYYEISGSESWEAVSTYPGVYRIPSRTPSNVASMSGDSIGKCSHYELCPIRASISSILTNGQFGWNLSYYLHIKDERFLNATTFKAYLASQYAAGTPVTLIYPINPITYTDLQDGNGNPLNPRYKVEQGGTEQVLPVNTSTPTTVAPTLTTTYTKDNN